ncbi:MAG: tetratricopeptide repeat protein, partial [Myxococcota bacterium]
PTTILARLSQRFKLLRSSRRDTNNRQATLKATLDWSWGLLDPSEKATMVQCASFQGTFSLEAAEAVVDLSMFPEDPWVIDLLESLVDKSLLRLTLDARSSEERYVMFLSVHDYALARLHDSKAVASPAEAPISGPEGARAVRHRHLQFFTPYGSWDFLKRISQDRRALDELGREHNNLTAAFRFAIEQRQPDDAMLCGLAICGIVEHRGPYSTGLDTIEAILELHPPDNILKARLLHAQGTLARSAGQPDRAMAAYRLGLQIAQALGAARIEGLILYGMGSVQRELGQRDQAQEHYTQSLQIAQTLGDRVLEGHALYGLAFIQRDQGQAEQALETFQACQQLAHATHHRLLEGSALQGLGWVQSDLGRLNQARTSYHACQQLAHDIGHKLLEGSVLCGLGYVLKDQGQAQEALDTFEACRQLARDIGHKRLEATTLDGLGSVSSSLGQWSQAADRYHDCIHLTRTIGLKSLECYALIGLGFVFEAQG